MRIDMKTVDAESFGLFLFNSTKQISGRMIKISRDIIIIWDKLQIKFV